MGFQKWPTPHFTFWRPSVTNAVRSTSKLIQSWSRTPWGFWVVRPKMARGCKVVDVGVTWAAVITVGS